MTTSNRNKFDYSVKIALVGNTDPYLLQKLKGIHNPIGSHFERDSQIYHVIELEDGARVRLDLWDIDHMNQPSDPYRGVQAAVLVYDANNQESYNAIKDKMKDERNTDQNDFYRFLVGLNKDPENNAAVSSEAAKQYAESKKCTFKDCATDNSAGIQTLFQEIATQLHQKQLADQHSKGSSKKAKKDTILPSPVKAKTYDEKVENAMTILKCDDQDKKDQIVIEIFNDIKLKDQIVIEMFKDKKFEARVSHEILRSVSYHPEDKDVIKNSQSVFSALDGLAKVRIERTHECKGIEEVIAANAKKIDKNMIEKIINVIRDYKNSEIKDTVGLKAELEKIQSTAGKSNFLSRSTPAHRLLTLCISEASKIKSPEQKSLTHTGSSLRST